MQDTNESQYFLSTKVRNRANVRYHDGMSLNCDETFSGFSFQGKLQYQETVTQGFKKMPEAFISLFRGGNTGKAVVKV